jgi:hypothetical protein
MGTFNGTYGSNAMMTAVSLHLDSIQLLDDDMDIHTVTLVLSGYSGEFDLVVEATDGEMEDHKWTGVAYRNGGVTDFKKVDV